MVVCKCKKATKLYCFVHKVPVCGECICFPEHELCVVRTYSEWVIDGEYDWPSKCCQCLTPLENGSASKTTRLGCLHIIHADCLISHIKSFPPHTAPAGYMCPSCSIQIWPPKNVKDSGSRLHSLLKDTIMQTGFEKNLFGNHPVSMTMLESKAPPPAFASDPISNVSSTGVHEYYASTSISKDETNIPDGYVDGGPSIYSSSEIMEIDIPSSAGSYMKSSSPAAVAMPRKGLVGIDRQNSENVDYADDEDTNRRKYSRRGPLRNKFLKALLPFWSSALPTLPVTAPPRKDSPSAADDVLDGRPRHQRSSRTDPRKILLFIAIMACMATMGILYYRLAQSVINQEVLIDDQ